MFLNIHLRIINVYVLDGGFRVWAVELIARENNELGTREFFNFSKFDNCFILGFEFFLIKTSFWTYNCFYIGSKLFFLFKLSP